MLENTIATTNKEPSSFEAIAVITGQKWVSLIIRDLAEGTQHFGELQHSLKISARVLSARLQDLEQQGLVSRAAFAE